MRYVAIPFTSGNPFWQRELLKLLETKNVSRNPFYIREPFLTGLPCLVCHIDTVYESQSLLHQGTLSDVRIEKNNLGTYELKSQSLLHQGTLSDQRSIFYRPLQWENCRNPFYIREPFLTYNLWRGCKDVWKIWVAIPFTSGNPFWLFKVYCRYGCWLCMSQSLLHQGTLSDQGRPFIGWDYGWIGRNPFYIREPFLTSRVGWGIRWWIANFAIPFTSGNPFWRFADFWEGTASLLFVAIPFTSGNPFWLLEMT